MTRHRDTRPRCPHCGHDHTGHQLDGVCLECDCPHRSRDTRRKATETLSGRVIWP